MKIKQTLNRMVEKNISTNIRRLISSETQLQIKIHMLEHELFYNIKNSIS